MIEVSDLYKSLAGKNVLNGINLKIDKGILLTIIGGSGTGKSVFLKNILGLMKPDKGDIKIDEVYITQCNKKIFSSIRKKIGMVFQGNALLSSLTLFENVALPLREHTKLKEQKIKELVFEKIAMVNLNGFEYYYPAELSGGMRKRAGIARSLINNPSILLYDEPTTGLDPVIGNIINNLIVDLRDRLGVTSIVVTHDIISALKISDKIAMLYQGKIVFEGTPEQIKTTDNPVVQQFIQGKTEGPITE
ncbi:MAG: ABC transporter ATP-binding protein [Candidatus Hydrogenedentota bacterium]